MTDRSGKAALRRAQGGLSRSAEARDRSLPKAAPTAARRLGELIRRRRLELELTQQAAADAAGMTQPQWADLEAGRFHPQIDTLARATRALRCTICVDPRGTIRLTAAPRARRAGVRNRPPARG